MGLREDIIADPACAEAYAARDCAELARIRSVDRIRLKHTAIGIGTILALDLGGAFLDTLLAMGANDRDVHWSMTLLDRGALDLGVQKLQDKLALMAAGMPQFANGIAALKALGYEPDPYSAADVAAACFNPNGSAK